MNKYTKSLAALILGVAAATTAVGVAEAHWFDGHGGRCGGYAGAEAPSPEAQKMMQDAYTSMAPKMLELRAKRDELTAKIYSGADQASIDALTREMNALQAKVNEERVKYQQQFAKAGVPMHASGRCMFGPGMGSPRAGGPGMDGHMGRGFGHMGGMRGHGPAMPPADR